MPNIKHKTITHTKAIMALILATAIWGGALPIISITEKSIPPFTFLLFRFIIVGIIMAPVMFIELKKTSIQTQDLFKLFILGLLGQTSIALIFWGVKYTTSIDAAIISTMAPLFTLLAGHYFFNEKINTKVKYGILIATLGTFFIVMEPILNQQTAVEYTYPPLTRIFGNLLIVLYNLSFTAYIIFSKVIMGKSTPKTKKALKFLHLTPLKSEYSPTLHTTFTFYVALLTFIPLALLESMGYFGDYSFSIYNLSVTPIIGLLYMAILSSIVAYIAYEWGLKNAQVSDGAIFGYLGPLFTIPFAYLILSELPTNFNLIGTAVIATGVYIAEVNKSYRNL